MWIKEVEFDDKRNPVWFILRVPKTKVIFKFKTIENMIKFMNEDTRAPDPAFVKETSSWRLYEYQKEVQDAG